jgi:hypothetical protein
MSNLPSLLPSPPLDNLGVEMTAVCKKGLYTQLSSKKFERVEPSMEFGKRGPVLWKAK